MSKNDNNTSAEVYGKNNLQEPYLNNVIYQTDEKSLSTNQYYYENIDGYNQDPISKPA